MQRRVERWRVVGRDDDVHDVVFLQQRCGRRDGCLTEPPELGDAAGRCGFEIGN
jgi:hypothetical protein